MEKSLSWDPTSQPGTAKADRRGPQPSSTRSTLHPEIKYKQLQSQYNLYQECGLCSGSCEINCRPPHAWHKVYSNWGLKTRMGG
eukprot:1994909-Rhodomonas_salina.1